LTPLSKKQKLQSYRQQVI